MTEHDGYYVMEKQRENLFKKAYDGHDGLWERYKNKNFYLMGMIVYVPNMPKTPSCPSCLVIARVVAR